MATVILSPRFGSLRELRRSVKAGDAVSAYETLAGSRIPASDGEHIHYSNGWFVYIIARDGVVARLGRKVKGVNGRRVLASGTRLGAQIGAGKGRLGKRGASATGILARVVRSQIGAGDITARTVAPDYVYVPAAEGRKRMIPMRRVSPVRSGAAGVADGASWVLARKRTGPDNRWHNGVLQGTANNGGERRG